MTPSTGDGVPGCQSEQGWVARGEPGSKGKGQGNLGIQSQTGLRVDKGQCSGLESGGTRMRVLSECRLAKMQIVELALTLFLLHAKQCWGKQ